jgi:phosphocarrier protein
VTRLDVEIANGPGLHSRAANRFVRLASTFEAEIRVEHGGASANGKSILGLLALAAPRGSVLRLFAKGSDADPALLALEALVKSGFGERGVG